MQRTYNVYHNLGYWFLLLILLVIAGFYSSYFTIFFEPKEVIVHAHFFLMSLWIIMLIVQPFLIKYKKLTYHRLLGKISYFLFPLVAISGYLMIRQSYYLILSDEATRVIHKVQQLNRIELVGYASRLQAIALFYLILFITFYCLAILNKKKSAIHARYMLASALTLLGPTVDRIIVFGFGLYVLPGSIPIETVAFFFADFVLAFLLYKDYKSKRPVKTLFICLSLFLIGQALYFTLPQTSWWPGFMALLLSPGR